MAPETGFLINDKLYEVPTLASLDGNECLILFEYSGLAQEDFAPLEGESEDDTSARTEKLMRHPGFWMGLMHIAYRREHRGLKDAKVKALIGSINRIDAVSTLAGEETEAEGDDLPPALTSELEPSSPRSSLENENKTEPSHESSGNGSTNGSAPQGETLEATTDTRSDTFSPVSPLRTSAP